MKSRFNVSLKRQPSHPLVVEIWKCWFDVLAATFWNKKLRNSAEKSKLTALNNALKTQALTREGFACALAIYLWAVLYFQKFISSIIEVSLPRNFQYTQLYNHVHALTGTDYMYQYFRGFGHTFGEGPLTPRVHTPFGRKTIFLRLL